MGITPQGTKLHILYESDAELHFSHHVQVRQFMSANLVG